MDERDAKAVRRALARWYRAEGRHGLPWRRTRDPYAVLVAEVMLQQTQVARVLPYYERWMARWPDVRSLAAASPAEVIRAWAGLGYNRRALHLHAAARVAVDAHGGTLPRTVEALRRLPGVGAYTAAAAACFAGGARTPVVDTNIARVLARLVLGEAAAKGCSPAAVRAAAVALLPPRGARGHNLALMDLGALVCTPRPDCGACPVASRCAWRRSGSPTGQAGPATRTAMPFAATARFARGRIVDALRSGPQTELALAGMLPEAHAGALGRYLAALEADGLAVQDGDRWSLPDEGGDGRCCFARIPGRMLGRPRRPAAATPEVERV